MQQHALTLRIIGFVASLILTLMTFIVVIWPQYFPMKLSSALLLIMILAILQAATQCVCFLHVLTEKGPRWNLMIFISTVGMATIIIGFAIWIMYHLNYNMMPSMGPTP